MWTLVHASSNKYKRHTLIREVDEAKSGRSKQHLSSKETLRIGQSETLTLIIITMVVKEQEHHPIALYSVSCGKGGEDEKKRIARNCTVTEVTVTVCVKHSLVS